MASYATIEGRSSAEIVEKKSRFIANVCHVETEEEALSFLEEIRAEHRMARHNVYAYVLKNGRVRYSDDGEPAKTAGMPTLEAIQHADVTDVIVVTTRYFGGVLLGTGGLVRAYTDAAKAGIEAAQRVVISRCVDLSIDLAYPQYEQALHLVGLANAKVVDTQFTDRVALTVRLLHGEEENLMLKLTELLRGSEHMVLSEAFEAAF